MTRNLAKEKFTPADLANALHAGVSRICILACAGSGKTYNLTRTIAGLVQEHEADPKKIAAITFTNMAADKLKSELSSLLSDKSAASLMFTGTIHSFCLDLLRRHADQMIDDWQVLNQSQQFVLLNRFWDKWEISDVAPEKTKTRTLERLCNTFNIVKMESIPASTLDKRHPEIARVFTLYSGYLRQNKYWDFADLISETLGRLRSDDTFKEQVLGSYEYIFVDEYQDVDPLQACIIEDLGKANAVYVVGDDDQSIYQFRGTDVKNILNFSRRQDTETHVLSLNRRCPRNILAVAENCVKKVASRYPKKMLPARKSGRVVIEQFKAVEDEARFIADEVAKLIATGAVNSEGDIAVLMRSVASYGEKYINPLRDRGLRCVVRGGRNLFDSEEVSNVVSVLEWIVKDPNLVCHLGLIADLFTGQIDTDSVAQDQDELGMPSEDDAVRLGLTAKDLSKLKSLIELREKYYLSNFGSVLEIIIAVIAHLELISEECQESALYNLARFTQIVREYESVAATRRLEYLCGFIQSYAARAYDEGMPVSAAKDAVNILTVHQAKGLEFDYVFVPMLVEKRFPLCTNSQRWLIDDDLFPSHRYYNLEENERRLLYVACSRAKKGLYLTCSKNVHLATEKAPSLFFIEARKVRLPDRNTEPELERSREEEKRFLVSSYSALEYYLTCPHRYRLLVVYGIVSPPNPFFEFGRLIHSMLAFMNRALSEEKEVQFKEIEQQYNDSFNYAFRAANLPHLTVEKQRARGSKALRKYYDTKGEWFENAREVEKDFEYMGENFLVKGRYDLICEPEEGQPVLIDFKTGQRHEYLRTDFQMQLYALAAVEQMTVPVDKAVLYYVDSGEEVVYDVQDAFLEDGRQNLKQVIDGIMTNEFTATPGKMCGRCEVRSLCEHKQTRG